MGRKRTWKGKYFYLYIAGLILCFLSGCALLQEVGDRRMARDSLLRGRRLLVQGDYDGALRENQKVLFLFKHRPPGDEALFNLGLIHAHGENPKKDYGKAIALFRRLLKEHPKSPLTEQARVWVEVLQTNERLVEANERLVETNERLVETNEKLVETNEKLNQLIEKSKKVDLEIEERRRERKR